MSSTPLDLELGGLDRATVDTSAKVEIISPSAESKASDSTLSSDGALSSAVDAINHADKTATSKRQRFLQKTKDILHKSFEKTELIATAPVLADVEDTVSDSRLVHELPEPDGHTLKEVLRHPVSATVSKVTGEGGHQIASNLVAKEISHGIDVELVRAYDDAATPQISGNIKERTVLLETLLKKRQAMFVRWTMDRHVTKVRILPVEAVPERSRNDFITKDEDGREKMDWQGWIRHSARYSAGLYGSRYVGTYSNPPTPSKETLMPAIERILVATAPLQTLIMSVRRVYRWENQNETTRYLIVYSLLWVLDLVLPGFVAAAIFLVVHRRIHPPTIEDIRKDIMRVESLTETALTLSDYIEKKGDQSWVDALSEELGPWAMIQLADMANLMEVVTNFYEWRVPSQSARTLSIMIVGFLMVTLVPIGILLRFFTLSCGIVFFGLFPIGSNFPEYRLLVSPLKWIFWDVPTHADWAIDSLQAEGQSHRNQVSATQAHQNPLSATLSGTGDCTSSPATSEEASRHASAALESETDDYGTYSCLHSAMHGKLILNARSVYFISSIGHKKHFAIPYGKIERVEKVMRPVSKGIGKVLNDISGEDLKITTPGGIEYLLKSMKSRDKAFSQIVGFSEVRWQVVW